MAKIKKANNGTTTTKTTVRPGATTDSTSYYKGWGNKYRKLLQKNEDNYKDLKSQLSPDHRNKIYSGYKKAYTEMANQAVANEARQKLKGKPGYDENGYPLKEKKMRNGGSLSGLKASAKRVGPVDPKGAFTNVQKKTLRGAKGKASLTKDKQLGATKMAKRGMSIKKK